MVIGPGELLAGTVGLGICRTGVAAGTGHPGMKKSCLSIIDGTG
jgi:hypothetical protein